MLPITATPSVAPNRRVASLTAEPTPAFSFGTAPKIASVAGAVIRPSTPPHGRAGLDAAVLRPDRPRPRDGRSGGKRRYDRVALQRVQSVVVLPAAGFTLEEIGALLVGTPPWQRLARRKLQELEGRIDELRQAVGLLESALECGCRRLETCGRVAHLSELGVHGR